MDRYDRDVLARPAPAPARPPVDAEPGLVVEDRDSGFCGAVVGFEAGAVMLEDRHGARRVFPLGPDAFLLDGTPVTLRRPAVKNPARAQCSCAWGGTSRRRCARAT